VWGGGKEGRDKHDFLVASLSMCFDDSQQFEISSQNFIEVIMDASCTFANTRKFHHHESQYYKVTNKTTTDDEARFIVYLT